MKCVGKRESIGIVNRRRFRGFVARTENARSLGAIEPYYRGSACRCFMVLATFFLPRTKLADIKMQTEL
jgi:hypothetical protein